MQPYAPRPIRCSGLETRDCWRLKRYAISFDGSPLDRGVFEEGLALARRALPEPAVAPGRPGLGFVVAHHGGTADYVVLCWWDQENELPTRILVRPSGEDHWRPASARESFCVWDLEVIGFERDTYVATMLDRKSVV